MHVTNREPCTLIIGDTQIAFGKTEAIDPAWEKRCEEMADRGALTLYRGGKPDDRPSRGMTPAELFAAMSPAEQRAVIAQVRAAEQGSFGPTALTLADAQRLAGTGDAAVGKADATEDTQPDGKAPTGAPSDFATCHVNKALAFVRKCTDVAVLTSLGNDENRESVLNAIIERIQVLEPKAN
jgi:hypothetical protein